MGSAEQTYPADTFEGRVLRGDPDALGEVIRWIAVVITAPRFWRLRGERPDLHQECLRRLLASLQETRFDSSRGFRAYVQSLARYTALEWQDRLPRTSALATPPRLSPLAAQDGAARQLLARSVMDRVPESCRNLFLLFFYEQHSHEEIADALRIPLGTVKSRIFRCIQTAHRLLGLPRGRSRYPESVE
jgi:RNA polymerase sigma factor (sigma-70 family)